MEIERYSCDEMLKKLARWLRLSGYDTISPICRDDKELKDISKKEHRVLLTRDKDLARSISDEGMLIKADDLDEQLEEVGSRFDPSRSKEVPSRCPICNGLLSCREISSFSDEGRAGIPQGVQLSKKEVLICDGCGHLFWTGSHTDRIRARLKSHGFTFVTPLTE